MEIVEETWCTPSTLNPALKGAERRRAGARHIVKHSAIDASPNARSDVARMHFAGEQLPGHGLGCTILHASMLMQNLLILMPAIVSQGVLPAPMDTGWCTFIDCSDVAAVATTVITQDSHDGHAYLATSEQALSVDDVSAHLSNAFARAIRYRNVPVEVMRTMPRARGITDWQVDQMVGSAEAFVAGEVTEVTDVVAHLTGHRPRSFAAFARELRAAA
jgi:uncharacterized protein YbjT (DUF2867 family)